MSEITLTRTQAIIVKKIEKSIFKATADVTEQTGLMLREIRRDLIQQVISQANSNTITLSLSTDVINSLIDRTAFHTKQHPNFNPDFRKGYTKPSKAGAQPIDTVIIMDKLRADLVGTI